jgi:hypothetical protein
MHRHQSGKSSEVERVLRVVSLLTWHFSTTQPRTSTELRVRVYAEEDTDWRFRH